MAFHTLPCIEIDWTVVGAIATGFERWQIWRRITGAINFDLLEELNDPAVRSFIDYTPSGDLQYDYSVGYVVLTGVDEVASIASNVAQAVVAIRNLFIQDRSDPSIYGEFYALSRSPKITQGISLVQPRASIDPVAHMSRSMTRSVEYSTRGSWADSDDGGWNVEAATMLEYLRERQYTDGATYLARSSNSEAMYCVIMDASRDDANSTFDTKITLQRIRS